MKPWMIKLIAIVVAAVLLAIGILILVRKLQPKEVVPEIVTMDIEGTINDIGELATAEYAYKLCQTMTKDGLKVPLTDIVITKSEVIYSYEGILKAGIEFGDIQIEAKEGEDTTKVYIRLPEVKLLSNEIDNNSLIIYDEKLSNFNKVSFADVNLSQQNLKDSAMASAISSGLLDRAKENAETIIRSTVLSLYPTDSCEIVFY